MDKIPYSNLSRGSLLVASPDIESGLYFRSVIVICEHTIEGSLGLILNKNLDSNPSEEALGLYQIRNPKVTLHTGGPIQPNQMMLLHSSDQIPQQTLTICYQTFLGGDMQFLQEAALNENGPYVHLCFGYSGWGSGQLEREFLNGLWFLCPGNPRYIFETPSDKMWQIILREMKGKYISLSMIPEDLSLN